MFSPAFIKLRDRISKDYPNAFRPSTGLSDTRRVSTGIFIIDRLLGGGLPVNRISLICGHKAVFKSTLAEKIVAEYQSVCNRCFLLPALCRCPDGPLKLMAVYEDIEKALDEGYMARMGVDISPERFHLLRPPYGELACEYTTELAKTPEVGLIIIDSLAGLVPLDEIEEGYSDSLARGLRARLVARMMRALVAICDSPVPRVVVMINHLLPGQKTGGFGAPPDILPGGETQKYFSSVVLKLWTVDKLRLSVGKDGEEKVDEFGKPKQVKVAPKKQRIGFLVEHSKISPDNISGEYALWLEEHDNVRLGDSDDWSTVFAFCQKNGLVTEQGSHYLFNGQKFSSQKAVMESWQTDRLAFRAIQRQLYK